MKKYQNQVNKLVAYKNALLLDPATKLNTAGGILVENTKIVDIGSHLSDANLPSHADIVDCFGAYLAPGLVDIRAHLGEPGEEHKETLDSASQAAVAGGITSLVCLPNTNPVIDDMSVVDFVARRARKLGLTKVYPYGAVTKNLSGEEIAELGLLAKAGAVAFTDGFESISNAHLMMQALLYADTFDLLVCQHPQEQALVSGGDMNAGDTASRLGLAGIPKEAEVIIVERDIRLLESTGGRIHFSNLSTLESVDAVRRAKNRGLQITCDTAPPYFALNQLAIGDYRTYAKLSPPLREETDRQAIVQGLIDGTIDCIASDHRPQDEESKRLPFSQAAVGGVGLETLLPISLELYHNAHLELIDVINLLTYSPASIMNLPAGRLEKGMPADFVLFDPLQGWKVNDQNLRSKSKNTPFDGRPVQGVVLRTVVDGRAVFNIETNNN